MVYCTRLYEKFDAETDWKNHLEGRQTFGVQGHFAIKNALSQCYQVAESLGYNEDFNTVVAYQPDTFEYEVLDDSVHPDIDDNAKLHQLIIAKQAFPANSQVTSFVGLLAAHEKDSVENLVGRVASKSLRLLKVLKDHENIRGWHDVAELVEIGRLSEQLRWKVSWEA